METVQRPETYPLLNEFFTTMAKGIVQNYCAICLRTEKERRLVKNKALVTYTASFSLKKRWKNKYICFICHRQAEKALTFLRAVSFAGNMDELYADLLYHKRLNKDVIQRAVFQAIIIKQGMVGLKSSPESWEKDLRIIRKATALKCRRTRVTGVGTGRPEHDKPSARNRYIVYKDPDDVSDLENELASVPTTSNHTRTATTATETIDLTASNHGTIDLTSSVNSEHAFAIPEAPDRRPSIDLELATHINQSFGCRGAGWMRTRTPLTSAELKRATSGLKKDLQDYRIRKSTHQELRRTANKLIVAEHNKSLSVERRKSTGPSESRSSGRTVRFDDEPILVGEVSPSHSPDPAIAGPSKSQAGPSRSRIAGSSKPQAGPSHSPVAGPSWFSDRSSPSPIADPSWFEDIPSPSSVPERNRSPVAGTSFAKDRLSRSPVAGPSRIEDIPSPLPVAGSSFAPDIRSRSPVAGPSWAPDEPIYAPVAELNPLPVIGPSWSLASGPILAEPVPSLDKPGPSTAEADPSWSSGSGPNRTYEGQSSRTDEDEHRRRALKGKSLLSRGSGPKRSKNRHNNAAKGQRSETELNIERQTVEADSSIVIPPQSPKETQVTLEKCDEDEGIEMVLEKIIPADMTLDPLLMGQVSGPAPAPVKTQKHDNAPTTSKKSLPKSQPVQNTATKKTDDKKHIQRNTNESRRLSVSGSSQSSKAQSVISRKRSLESVPTIAVPCKVSVLPNTAIGAGLSSYKIPKRQQNPSVSNPAMSPQYSQPPPWSPDTSQAPPTPLARLMSASNVSTIKVLNTLTSEPPFNPLMPPPGIPASYGRRTPTNIRGLSPGPAHPGTASPSSSPQLSPSTPRTYVRTSPASIPVLELDTGRSQYSLTRYPSPRGRPQTARRGYGRATPPNVRVPGAPRTPTDGSQVFIRAQAAVGISPDPHGPRMGRPAHGPPHRPRYVGRNEGQPPVQDAIRRYTMTSEE